MNITRTVTNVTVLLFLILPSVYAIGLIDPPTHFDVLPGQIYSADFCIKSDMNYTVSLTNNSGLIEEFYLDEFYPYEFDQYVLNGEIITSRPDIKCTTMHIKISDYKTSNEELITEEVSATHDISDNMKFGVATKITFDASEVSYVNAFLKFSGKLVLTVFSIFAMLTVLLYMIRKIRKE